MRDNLEKKLQENTDYIIQKELEEAARKVEEEMGTPAETPLRAQSNGDEEFQKLMHAVKTREQAENTGADEKKAGNGKKRARRILKYAAIFVLCAAGVFGVSMTSEANRLWLVSSVNKIFSDSAEVVVNNDEKRVKTVTNEREAAEVIKEKTGIEVPDFLYKPQKMDFDKYEYDEDSKVGIMYYVKGEQIITLYMGDADSDTAESSSYDGELTDETVIPSTYADCIMWKTRSEGDTSPFYVGQWSYRNCLYRIWGKLTREEMSELLGGIMF
ncbi:MAG: DUF4367 domain-containing protein [Lachnospiraceae bacterium]|nr:DUF4367 domain-containing protein [Lachnospiraceae bacterium]